MSFNQIKNKVVPPAKRTAQAVEQWVAAMPDIPQWASMAASIPIVLLKAQLKSALQNPTSVLMGAAAAAAAVTVLGPVGGALLAASFGSAALSFAAVAVICYLVLCMFTVYNSRVALAKAMVMLLDSM